MTQVKADKTLNFTGKILHSQRLFRFQTREIESGGRRTGDSLKQPP
jgi:hypothetical protein